MELDFRKLDATDLSIATTIATGKATATTIATATDSASEKKWFKHWRDVQQINVLCLLL